MPRFNGDIDLDGILIFPSGADNRMAIRSIATESPTGEPASGQIRFLQVGNEEGYWYLFNSPTPELFDFDAGSLPSGARVATLADLAAAGVSSLNGLGGIVSIIGGSGIETKIDVDGIITINASGIDVLAGDGMTVSEETLFNNERLWRISSNQTQLEGELTDGTRASGLVRITSPSGTIEARTVGNQIQIDVDLDVITSGLLAPTTFSSGISVADTVWNATHLFGSDVLIAQAYDLNNLAIYPDEIEIINSDNIRLTWNTAQDGTLVILR